MIKNVFRTILAIAAILNLGLLQAQTPVELHISHKLGTGDFAFNQTAQNDLNNEFTVNRLEYYISKISIWHDGGMVTTVPNHYILANAAQPLTDALGSFNITTVDSISLHIGVDAPVNNADPSLHPVNHPLAPKSPSMHWGWSAGYRFVAMEGKSGANLAKYFEIHALGNMLYFKTTIPVAGVMKNGKMIIPLQADYTKALKGINMSSGLIAHGDGADEAKVLANFRDEVFSAGNPVSVTNITTTPVQLQLHPNPATGGYSNIIFDGTSQVAAIIITDIQGRTIMQNNNTSSKHSMPLHLPVAGLYFVKVQYADGHHATAKLIVQ